MFKNAFSFNGRIRRTEYGITFIIYFLYYILQLCYEKSYERSVEINLTINLAIMIGYIPILWLLWAQGAKRCHDLGKSGWWQIIPFYFFVLLFSAGNPYPNEYDIGGAKVEYGADDYERPFDINEPVQSAVTSAPANDIVPPATNE